MKKYFQMPPNEKIDGVRENPHDPVCQGCLKTGDAENPINCIERVGEEHWAAYHEACATKPYVVWKKEEISEGTAPNYLAK